VAFEILPAIDMAGGQLARWEGGRPGPVAAFGGDPVAAARAFVDAGARWLHVVDLDLAFLHRPANIDLVSEIAALGVSVQASGGLTTVREIAAMLEAGASRAVMASAALHDRSAASELVRAFGDRLVVGLEVDGGWIRPRGAARVRWAIDEVIPWVVDRRVPRTLITAVARVGELTGPDLDTLRRVALGTGRPVIASGGVATIEQIRMVAAIRGMEGVVVGRALHDRAFDLDRAFQAVQPATGR